MTVPSSPLRFLWLLACLMELALCETTADCSGRRSSFLWRVGTEPPVFLLGTIHVPYKAVWGSMSAGVKLALNSVRTVHFELDLTSDSTMRELRKCQVIEDAGTQLEDLLPDGLTDRISRHLNSLSQHLNQPHQSAVFFALTGNWRRLRPIWLALTLASLTPDDLANFGTEVLDVFLTRRARKRGQQVRALESVDDHCRPLNSIPADEAALALDMILTHLEQQLARYLSNRDRAHSNERPEEESASNTDLVRRYRCGTLDGDFAANNASILPMEAVARLVEPQLSRYRSLLRKLKRSLLQRRNRRMADRVIQEMSAGAGQAQLFAVGIGHLLGEQHSVVTHLRDAGYAVQQVGWNQTDPSLQAAAGIVPDELEEPPGDRHAAEQLRRSQQAEATRAEEWAKWEEAKRYARYKWQEREAPIEEEPWSTAGQDPPPPDTGESAGINLIMSAGRSNANTGTLLICVLVAACTLCSKTVL